MEIKKTTGNCDFKIFKNESKKRQGPFWKFFAKSFQTVKKKPGKRFFVWKNIQNNFGKSNKKVWKSRKKYGILVTNVLIK